MLVILAAIFALLLCDTLMVPSSWRQVKIGEERDALLQRLGQPRIAGWDVKGDEWSKLTGIGGVAMRVSYNSRDGHIVVWNIRWSHWIGYGDFKWWIRRDSITAQPNTALEPTPTA